MDGEMDYSNASISIHTLRVEGDKNWRRSRRSLS